MLSKDWFAILPVTKVWKQQLKDVTELEARAEGFSNLAEFRDYWARLNGKFDPELEVFVVEWDPCRMEVNKSFKDGL